MIVDAYDITAVSPNNLPAPLFNLAIPVTTYPIIISGMKNDRKLPNIVLKVLKILIKLRVYIYPLEYLKQ